MKKFDVIYNQTMRVVVEAETREKAREIVMSGEFDESDVENNGIDLSSVDAQLLSE